MQLMKKSVKINANIYLAQYNYCCIDKKSFKLLGNKRFVSGEVAVTTLIVTSYWILLMS